MIERNRGLLLASLGVAMLLATTSMAYRPPAALGPDAAPSVFSAARAQIILKQLVGNGLPHPIGSVANGDVREGIVKQLQQLGYAPQLQSGFICNDRGGCGTPTNIVATLGGDITSDDAVLLGAHYDSVPAGPGASDDGAGVAALLEIARILKGLPAPRHPIVLLVTDGEEAGLLGAVLFTHEHPLSKQVRAAVNMEARGVSGASLMFETGTANAWLMHLYAAAIARPITNSLNYVVYKSLPNDTDFTVFKAAAYQGFNFAFIGDVGHYHTPLDTWANASAASLQHQGDNALSAVLALANSADVHPPIGESVFFDVLARTVVIWPAKFVLPASLGALALLLAQAALLFRRGHVRARQFMWGAIGVLINVALSALLSVGSIALLRALGKLPPLSAGPWIAHPTGMSVAAATIAVLTAGGVSAWLGRRAGFWGFWLAASLFIGLLSIVVSAMIPGASFVILLAALAAAFGCLPCMPAVAGGRAASRGAIDFCALFPGLIFLAATLPMLLLLYSALGALAWPMMTVTLSLATCLLLPLLANATRRARQRLVVLSGALTLGGIIVTLLVPTYNAMWPQRLNVEYWFDADLGKAHWWVQAASGHLPQTIAGAANFDPVPRPRFEGYPQVGFFAAAPTVSLLPPQLTVTAATPLAAKIHYQLRLKSLRDAAAAFVVFPAGAGIQEIVVETKAGPLHAKLIELRNGATAFRISGLSAEGMEFGIDATAGPIAVEAIDLSYGLPSELSQGRNLQQSRPLSATSSQDGDLTVGKGTVWLEPAAGR
jgi:hypothetical protein